MSEIDYKVRCDKHTLKPYEYCEMCYIRSYLQDAIEDNRKMVQGQVGQLQIIINDFYNFVKKATNKINELE